jgi:hypothetical protein
VKGSDDETGLWSEDGAGGDETEQFAPPTEVRTSAWSDEQREDQPDRGGQSWKQVGLIAAAIFVPLTALVVIIGLWLQQRSKPPAPEPSRAPQPTSAVASPPVTVTAPPPVTVTQPPAPPPVTVTAPPANETFIICPDGHSGVATGVTSCQFAMNVRQSYLSGGGPTVIAYSPVTGDTYQMQCLSGYTSHLNNGLTVNSVRCTGGNNAVVILW